MNRLHKILLASLATLGGLLSCSVEDMPVGGTNGDKDGDIIRITASITEGPASGGLAPKVQIGESGSGNFDTGDAISLFVTPEGSSLSERRELTLASNVWTPELKWSEFGAERARFLAFYPAVNGDGVYVHSVSQDQTTEEGYLASDLLSASVSASKGEEVNLKFSHLMSRVKVVLSASGETTQEDLASATVRIATSKSISVNLSDMTLVQTSESTINVLTKRSGNTFRAVVCPEVLKKEWKESAWIVVESGDKTYNYTAPETLDSRPFTMLEPGKEVTINITLNKKPVTPEPEPQPQPGDFAGRTVWVKGLKNMPDPDTWKRIWTFESLQGLMFSDGLKWDSSYGWFDCKKIYPSGFVPVFEELSGTYDGNLCWAATAANMIYWWMEVNKDNIERYGKYKGPKKYGADRDTGDDEWQKHFHAEIFDFFKNHFQSAKDVNSALSWFFTGCFATSLGVPASEAAFFKDVLGEGVAVSRNHGVSAGRFTDVVKEALAEGRVLGINHYIGLNNYHAINLWGATFDEAGEISHIYVTDSNAGRYIRQEETQTQTPAGLEKRAVKVVKGYTCMEGSTYGDYSLKIDLAYSIDSMADKWESYFAK